MRELRVEAKTVKEAIEKGLKELNLTRDQVEVEIVREEKKGIFGIHLQDACVIIREKSFSKTDDSKEKKEEKEIDLSSVNSFTKSENPLEDVKKILTALLGLSKIDLKITKELYDEATKMVYINIQSKDAGLLLYDGAKGLLSLQQIISLIINRYYDEKITVRIDTEEFWNKTELKLKRDVEHAIEFIKRTKKPYKMRPMPSSFRKIIHNMIKANYPDYSTQSIGKGKFRRVTIRQQKSSKDNSQLTKEQDTAQQTPSSNIPTEATKNNEDVSN